MCRSPFDRTLREKRLKGLEPSTFCMASRRSSQLSYSRNGEGQVYRGRRFAEPLSGVLDLLALLHIQLLQELQQPRDVVLLVVHDPLHGLLGVLVRQREGLLLEAIDREQLVGQVLPERLQIGGQLGQSQRCSFGSLVSALTLLAAHG